MRKLNFAKWLYRHFGIILPFLREQWDKDAKTIQFKLDNIHKEVDKYNRLHNTDYTTREVIIRLTI